MAFSKAACFPDRGFSTPHSPKASLGLPSVCAYTFGQRSRLHTRDTAMLPVVAVANLQLAEELGRGGLGTVLTQFFQASRLL